MLVLSGKCTLEELETTWSLDDVARALAIMSAQSCRESMYAAYLAAKTKRS